MVLYMASHNGRGYITEIIIGYKFDNCEKICYNFKIILILKFVVLYLFYHPVNKAVHKVTL